MVQYRNPVGGVKRWSLNQWTFIIVWEINNRHNLSFCLANSFHLWPFQTFWGIFSILFGWQLFAAPQSAHLLIILVSSQSCLWRDSALARVAWVCHLWSITQCDWSRFESVIALIFWSFEIAFIQPWAEIGSQPQDSSTISVKSRTSFDQMALYGPDPRCVLTIWVNLAK